MHVNVCADAKFHQELAKNDAPGASPNGGHLTFGVSGTWWI
jgi:hypothetical protein